MSVLPSSLSDIERPKLPEDEKDAADDGMILSAIFNKLSSSNLSSSMEGDSSRIWSRTDPSMDISSSSSEVALIPVSIMGNGSTGLGSTTSDMFDVWVTYICRSIAVVNVGFVIRCIRCIIAYCILHYAVMFGCVFFQNKIHR